MEYQDDIYDPMKFARSPNVTPSLGFGTGIANFGVATLLGDIVAINGQPARGLYAVRSRVIIPIHDPGRQSPDVTRVAIQEHMFEILQPDGTPIASIMANPPREAQQCSHDRSSVIYRSCTAILTQSDGKTVRSLRPPVPEHRCGNS
jgi:hypothetical protein